MADLDAGPGPGFEELLRRAAARPAEPFDPADVSRRVRRIKRNRRIGSAAFALVLLAPLTLAGRAFLVPETTVDFASGGGRAVTTTDPRPSDRSTPASTPSAPPSTRPEPQAPPLGAASPAPGVSPSASPRPKASATPTRQSSATVVISDAPGSPERRPDLPGDRRHPDVLLTLTLERTQVRQGEHWSGWLEARNTGDEPLALGDADCWALWGLYADGKWVGGQRDSVCGDTHPRTTLAPDAMLRVPLAFDTVAGEDRDKGMRQLAAGKYTAAAALRVQTPEHGYSGVWYAPTVTVTVSEPSPQGP